ncbi:MAG TPA: hypothetical protein VHQ21_16255 [Rhodanobacteraceae bacterium]|jgi:hypothetical protein|nr:hypothetical protein [Rhodanobacteraceae bacterium]
MVERKSPVPEETRSTPNASDHVKVRKRRSPELTNGALPQLSVRLPALSFGHQASGSGRFPTPR